MIIHAAALFEADTARLLWLAEEYVQKPSKMMGVKGVRIKGLVRASEDVQKQLFSIKSAFYEVPSKARSYGPLLSVAASKTASSLHLVTEQNLVQLICGNNSSDSHALTRKQLGRGLNKLNRSQLSE